jgi:Uma2 family endonuclease
MGSVYTLHTEGEGMPSMLTALTVSDLLYQLGDVPAARVRLQPTPGTASEVDVVDVYDHEHRLCELVDGVLVEKAMGYYESYLAAMLIRLIGNFVVEHDLGIVAGADGMMRLAPGLVRIPDVSLVLWEKLPGRRVPRQPIPDLVPDFVVEVLSEGNTPREMTRKLDEYFLRGVRLVWLVDPVQESIEVYTSRHQSMVLDKAATADGGAVLPGFTLPLHTLFTVPGH